MTEREVELLGFEKVYIKEYDEDESYYYVLDIVDGLTLITRDCYEPSESGHEILVSIFNTDPEIRWESFGELQGFINSVTNKIVHAK